MRSVGARTIGGGVETIEDVMIEAEMTVIVAAITVKSEDVMTVAMATVKSEAVMREAVMTEPVMTPKIARVIGAPLARAPLAYAQNAQRFILRELNMYVLTPSWDTTPPGFLLGRAQVADRASPGRVVNAIEPVPYGLVGRRRHNHRRRSRSRSPRDGGADRADDAEKREMDAFVRRLVRPADWLCPSCGGTNFARRIVCFQCGREKPPHPELVPTPIEKDFDPEVPVLMVKVKRDALHPPSIPPYPHPTPTPLPLHLTPPQLSPAYLTATATTVTSLHPPPSSTSRTFAIPT